MYELYELYKYPAWLRLDMQVRISGFAPSAGHHTCTSCGTTVLRCNWAKTPYMGPDQTNLRKLTRAKLRKRDLELEGVGCERMGSETVRMQIATDDHEAMIVSAGEVCIALGGTRNVYLNRLDSSSRNWTRRSLRAFPLPKRTGRGWKRHGAGVMLQ